MLKKILLVLLLAFVSIQFIRPDKNTSSEAQNNDIAVTSNVPGDVNITLRKACYDCHSNTTNYPWYAEVQPVAWWLANHIYEGKDELNFSEFGSYSIKRKIKKYNEIATEVTDGEMPLGSYTWVHKDAKLSKEERNVLINWANEMAHKLERDSTLTASQ